MEHPSEERLPDTEKKGPQFYEKDKGSAGIHGQIFEYKFCALSFLRATNKGYKFKLASNVKGFGAFDDVVVEYLDEKCSKKHIFLQLKSKVNQKVTMQQFQAGKGDFSLRKYYESYIQIEENFNCNEGVKMDGGFDESLFIIYTNTDVARDLKPNKVTDIGEEKFLKTGGSVLQFNEEEHKDIYEHLQELPKHREFLSRLRIFYNQADEKEMDCHIKPELQQSMKLPESELDLTYMCFIDCVKDWWQNFNYFLEDTNSKENDILRKTTEKARTNLVAKILDQRKIELDDLSIRYKQSAITDMGQMIRSHKAILIFSAGQSTTLTTAKIHQTLSATKHVILNLQQLIQYKTEVMLAWKSMFDVLVLEGQSSTANLQDTFNEISMFLNECDVKKKFIFISSAFGNIQQTIDLRKTFSTNLKVEYDDWKFTDLVTDTRMFILEKKVYFQGAEIKLSDIVKNYDVGMLNALGCDSISRLLGNEKLSIGIPIEDTVQYYVDRTLLCNKDIKTRFPVQEETNSALNNVILQELQSISSYREKELDRETFPILKPSTLFELEDRVILVTDEPGMGKSTLLTHLAKETRKRHPDMWIVRININNYTRILNELKKKCCDENGAIKLLTKAAKVKEIDGLYLQRRLFDYTCSFTGNMAVLIDGVDEVSPLYTEQVVQILRLLTRMKIKKIWVTFRNSMKGFPPHEFQCHSYSLAPFTEKDQKCFLVKFWKEKFPDVKCDCLEHLAQRVVELSMKHLTAEDNNFMGIPLQCVLLAEMFEEYLQQYSTAAIVELPDHINVVTLYDRYVEKKWDIYLSEKKVSDRTNVNVLIDDNALHTTFIDNHTAAAFVAILSTNQLEKLADKTIAKIASDFLKNIEKGEEKTGLILDVIEERPVFQHRTLAEYFVAKRLCKNISASQTFMKDHLLESQFGAIRSMVDRILADKCPVHEAVLNSNVHHVTELLRQTKSISEKDYGERTPLHIAISCCSTESIRLLLEHGADVSTVDTLLGLSPVDYATRMKDWEVLTLMMEKRPDIREQVLNETSQHGVDCITSALRASAQFGHNYLLKYLTSRGNFVNAALPGDNSTLLHVAVKSQQTETIQILLQLGASTVSQDPFGRTPLHVAVENLNLEVIQCLVESQKTVQREREVKNDSNPERTVTEGNFLNVPDRYGNTPLHLGVAAGNTNIVSYLMSAGIDKKICNIRGEYPLTLAARCAKNDIVELLMKGEVHCETAQIGALRAAIVAGHVDTTTLLLRLGAPVNKGENEKPIHVASQLGRKEIVSLLLQYGAILTSRNYSGNTALHLASGNGHLSLVTYLVEEERDLMNALNFENETPLHLAVRNGRDYLVNYFAEKGCNINATSANGASCLHVACANGHYTTVECLLKHGAAVNTVNSDDQTSLHITAIQGQTKIVELLFLHNANISLRDKDGITALLAASINGHEDTVLFIVQHGGNIEDTDGKGNSIAHFAAANGNYEILNFLLQQNVSLDVQNSDGDTPLLQAVREERNRMVQYLVERNSDINTQSTDGMRPLDVAVQKGNKEISRLLLERNLSSCKTGIHMVAAARFAFLDFLQRFVDVGDDINMRSDNGECPLHAACKSGHVTTVQYLCEHGAILDLQDNNGNTALHVAVSNGHLDVTRVLVEKGANLCTADASGSTALHIAAKDAYLNIVRYLVDSLAPIDRRNAKNETALLVAAVEGHEKVVSVLIDEGAGIGVRDIEGNTALDLSRVKGYTAIEQLLKDRAEGRKVVCSISDINVAADSEGDTFEHLHRTANAGASEVTDTDRNGNNTEELLKTRADNTVQFHSDTRSALHIAAANCKLEEVQLLVEDGVALDCGDLFGRTALWGAAKRGHKSIIKFLLQNGSCVNVPDCEGFTPIDIAVIEGHWDAVDEFLKHDPIIGPEGRKYLTKQLYEALESDETEVVRKILKCGISVDTNNKYGYAPLHVAVMSGHIGVTRVVLESGATVNATDCDGKTPIMIAAERGYVEMVRGLLNYNASVNTTNEESITPLSSALANGHVEVLKELLNYGAEVDNRDEFGCTPLYTAAGKGEADVVRELLNHGASVNLGNIQGASPLQIAAREGHVEIVRELLKHGVNVNLADEESNTPLGVAAKIGHVEIFRELLNHGADVDLADEKGNTLLCIAAKTGHVEIVRELLKHGASVDLGNREGNTPLGLSGRKGHADVVRELLNHGASVDLANREGITPLGLTVEKGHIEIARELLKHGASVDLVPKGFFTPLQLAVEFGHVEVIRELLKYGANVNYKNVEGITPLHIVAQNGTLEVVRELLKHDANVNLKDKEGNTPLQTAIINDHIEVVRELLKHGANVNLKNTVGIAPLHVAAKEGNLEVVRELLKNNASVNLKDTEGNTPLQKAIIKHHKEVVLELLKHGANVNLIDEEGNTPLHLVAKEGNLEVVRELLKHGASVNLKNEEGKIPLEIALDNDHKNVFIELLKHDNDMALALFGDLTPIEIAAFKGNVGDIQELLSHGVSADEKSEEGFTPLQLAAKFGHVEVVRLLLKHGANVNVADEEGYTLLHSVAEEGNLEVVRELMKHGASVNLADKEGNTPLQIALNYDHQELVREMLNHGATVDLADLEGPKPIQISASKDQVEVMRGLPSHDVCVDLADEGTHTSLHLAALIGHVEVVGKLLSHGASADLANEEGNTPLQLATIGGHVEVVRALLNHGTNADLANEAGNTPLQLAVEIGHLEVIQELLKHGANVDLADKEGKTPLHLVSQKGNLVVVRELLKYGATVNLADKEGYTPLQIAGNKDHIDVFLELLNHGASVDIVDTES